MKFGLIILVLAFPALAASPVAPPSRKQLTELIAQLEKTPDDAALREKIIKLAQRVKPGLTIPEEANRAFIKGNVFQKEANDASGFDLAIAAYREALRLAPWWGDAYFNLAVALEAAGKFDEAIASIKLYVATVPGASAEAREAKNRIYAIEAKSEMASRLAATRAEAERERLRPTVEGVWTDGMIDFRVTKSGDHFDLIPGMSYGQSNQWAATDVTVDRQRVRFGYKNLYAKCPECNIPISELSLSENGNELKGTSTVNGRSNSATYKRKL